MYRDISKTGTCKLLKTKEKKSNAAGSASAHDV